MKFITYIDFVCTHGKYLPSSIMGLHIKTILWSCVCQRYLCVPMTAQAEIKHVLHLERHWSVALLCISGTDIHLRRSLAMVITIPHLLCYLASIAEPVQAERTTGSHWVWFWKFMLLVCSYWGPCWSPRLIRESIQGPGVSVLQQKCTFAVCLLFVNDGLDGVWIMAGIGT